MAKRAIKPIALWAPRDEIRTVVPSDTDDIDDVPTNGCILHNIGTSGAVFIDAANSGTNISIYLRQGDFAPVLVKRAYSTGLGAGVSLVALF